MSANLTRTAMLIRWTAVAALSLCVVVAARSLLSNGVSDDGATGSAQPGAGPAAPAPERRIPSRPMGARLAPTTEVTWPGVTSTTPPRVDVPGELSPFQQAMLDDTRAAMATRLAWEEHVRLWFTHSRSSCLPPTLDGPSVLEIAFQVQSDQARATLSDVRVEVKEGAPLPDTTLRCFESRLTSAGAILPAAGQAFLQGFSDQIRGRFRVGS
jgi:hypothetical protein